MTKRQRQLLFGALFMVSFMSSIYLNIELSACDTAFSTQDVHRLPDIDVIKHIVRIFLEPLRIG